MAVLGLPLVLLGGVSLYAAYKEHNWIYGGDTLKTVGPAPPDNYPSVDGQARGGVVAPQVMMAGDAITNPMDGGVLGKGRHAGHVRQSVARRVDPFSNRQLRANPARTHREPGGDPYPQGMRQYVPPTDYLTGTEESMKTPHFDQVARFDLHDQGQHSVAMGNAVPPADAGKPLLYAKPVASYLTTQRHMVDAGSTSSMMVRPNKKNMHLHRRSNAPDLGMWTAKETRETTDTPAASDFWDGKPKKRLLAEQFSRRNQPNPNIRRLNPNFAGEMGRTRQLWTTKLVEAP